MKKILLSPMYEATTKRTTILDRLYGFAFYSEEVGFGKIEEGYSESDEPATIISFTDANFEPVVSICLDEASPEIAIEAIKQAITQRR